MFIIYSVFNSEVSEEHNIRNHNRELRELAKLGVPVRECLGVYKDCKEYSLQVPREFSNIVKQRAWAAKQECVLLVNELNQAFLVYPNDIKRLGKWVQTTTDYSGDYTVINNRKFTVR
jgi:hypothetical protein